MNQSERWSSHFRKKNPFHPRFGTSTDFHVGLFNGLSSVKNDRMKTEIESIISTIKNTSIRYAITLS